MGETKTILCGRCHVAVEERADLSWSRLSEQNLCVDKIGSGVK
jgi:hypothetical protein